MIQASISCNIFYNFFFFQITSALKEKELEIRQRSIAVENRWLCPENQSVNTGKSLSLIENKPTFIVKFETFKVFSDFEYSNLWIFKSVLKQSLEYPFEILQG